MTTSLDNILSGGEAASGQDEQVVENASQAQESQGEGDRSASDVGEGQHQEVESERLRGAAAQLAARDKAHSEALAAREKELNDEWRRRFASEIPRQLEIERSRWQEEQARQQPKQDPVDRVLTDPEAFIRQYLEPVRAELSKTREYNSRQSANREFGEDKISEAYAALDRAASSGDREALAVVAAVKHPEQMDPWGEIGRWHQRQQRIQLASDPKISSVLEKIGSDPSLLEKFEAFIANPSTAEPHQAQQRPAPVMPSNIAGARNVGSRGGVPWSGPAPLQDIFDRGRPSG